MDFGVEASERNGCALLAVTGELDIYTAPRLEEELQGAADSSASRVVVDLTRTSFIDSTGLSVLVSALKRVTEAGGDFALICQSRQRDLLRVMEITGLLDIFTIHESVQEAGLGN